MDDTLIQNGVIATLAKISLFLVILVGPAVCDAASSAKPERETVLARCEEYFGPAVDNGRNLFEANTFYVLAVKFDEKGRLAELALEPKYFYSESHPDWEEQNHFEYLSWIQYQNFVTRLDLIKPKGKLIKPPAPVSFVTNRTSWQTSIYKHGRMTLGILVDLDEPDDAPARLTWFRVEYGNKAKKDEPAIKVDWDRLKKATPEKESQDLVNN